MRKIKDIYINCLLILMIYLGEIQGITYLLNIATFCLWVIVVARILSLFIEEETLFKDVIWTTSTEVVRYTLCLFLIGLGWFWLGGLMFLTSLITSARYRLYKGLEL